MPELPTGHFCQGWLALPPVRWSMSAEALIRRYRLVPHPEGGWYREVHRSDEEVSRADGARRAALTTILFLLAEGEISRWHRVSNAAETWHPAGGAPLELLSLPPQGGRLQRQRLALFEPGGEITDPEVSPVAIVPAGWWQAARSLGAWSLVSCCVGPGFDAADFTLLRDLPADAHPQGALTAFL